ncbi:hypothetical protein VIBNISFn27_550069 [Vibrio nigripulchritudo SFn27]|uniref:Uncharacterized protein n=1 Tax=Vibrio nigripulchritudo TaxID=28173 RepID=U4K9Z6_9VIBR|nr:hypothetical protein [Vibrio nigripulchritudo]CCN85489.1 hypothetical protein VIBNIBLFn1_940026 [Vibrio nigripulchritudo BLFn1]CCN89042.1 hypothetical protein VIBNISFn27_550069 [Vibrio nigripulchritudo SFn27]CCN95458.1 hypothetical protein VIBNIENn2_570026 [Vibrio nigripulchritudo ENn2]CCO43215.1 hypothetical protein VIBNISFn135_940027 [Vibrio nigripulchritudo SFn135]CCO54499.1 hypothetical protein VIBNIWn13_70068 [Vibrio nigripulchritudo Wn13]
MSIFQYLTLWSSVSVLFIFAVEDTQRMAFTLVLWTIYSYTLLGPKLEVILEAFV